MEELTIGVPDDAHVHFRQGDLLKRVVPITARWFGRALVMPNTSPPIKTAGQVIAYRREIEDAATTAFSPLMAVYLTTDTTVGDVADARHVGAVAFKLYPHGATTGSHGGVPLERLRELKPVFAAMERLGLILCLHGEDPDETVMRRESAFLTHVRWLAETFPDLKIVLEHITMASTVNWIIDRAYDNVAATITVHHLRSTIDDFEGLLLNPYLHCKPKIKDPQDRARLVWAATSGDPRFFLGSDSAPHPVSAKECSHCAAGVFSAPVLLPVLAEVFEAAGALDKLEGFASRNGAAWYGLAPNQGTITLARQPWTVPERIADLVPYCAGEELAWRVVRREP